jgi:hypothetical protein
MAATFTFASETLPALHAQNVAFTSAMTKVRESLSNLEVIRCFAYHFDPPNNYRTLFPPSDPDRNLSQAQLVQMRTWLSQQQLVIIPADLPGMYARYDYMANQVEINVNVCMGLREL